MPVLPHGVVTFLFTDIEGSTRLWEQFPDAMRLALAHHDALLRQAIERNSGSVFKTVGDAFCAIFPTAANGLAAALAAQQSLHSQPWPAETPLRVRMALHTGAAEERDGDYFGPTLNRIARLLAIGHGGQTLLTEATRDAMRAQLPEGMELRDMASHRLKDLQQPEHIYQLLHSSLPDAFPPLRSLQAFANNLPVQPTSFIGREPEMEKVKRLFAGASLLTLTGSGGCGKTRMGLQVAADLLEDYPDGVWLTELAPLFDPAFVVSTVASALGLREEPNRPLLQTLTDYLQSKTLLLVLDNCEHLLDACAQMADALLRHCPKLRILATSRQPLGLPGEVVCRVASLPTPPQALASDASTMETMDRSALLEYPSVQLFLDRVYQAYPEFHLAPDDLPHLAQICRRLDGIPLALELAAYRVRALSLEKIADRLENRFQLLTGGSRAALPRQQTLRALIDWSFQLLDPAERRLLARLSVFAGGWTLERAEQVCAGEGLETWDILDRMTSLTEKSLALYEDRQERYRFLETILAYARERLEELGEAQRMRRQHAEVFLRLAQEAEPELTGRDQVAWMKRLDAERENLRAALANSRTTPQNQGLGLKLAGLLWRYWLMSGAWREGVEHLSAALSGAGSAADASDRGNALNGIGVLAYRLGDFQQARLALEECAVIREALEDRMGLTGAFHNLANVKMSEGDLGEARRYYEMALQVNRELGLVSRQAYNLVGLGTVAGSAGDIASARAASEEALALFRETNDSVGELLALGNLGQMALADKEAASAESYALRALELSRSLGNQEGEALYLPVLGGSAQLRGDFAKARACYRQALEVAQRLGDKRILVATLRLVASLDFAEGDSQRAVRLHACSASQHTRIGLARLAYEQAEYEAELAAAKERLGASEFATLWDEGTLLSLEEGILLAK